MPQARVVGCEHHIREHHIREPSGVQFEVWRSVMNSPNRVRGGTLAASDFFIYIIQISISSHMVKWCTLSMLGQLQAKNGTRGHPGRTVILFRDTSLKIRTVLENLGRMVTVVDKWLMCLVISCAVLCFLLCCQVHLRAVASSLIVFACSSRGIFQCC